MNTTFDINRFKSLMKYEYVSESKKMLRTMMGMSLALSVYYCFQVYLHKDALIGYATGQVVYSTDYNPIGSLNQRLAMFAFFVCATVAFGAACSVFKNMLTKQNRISFLALPASNLEKFVARLLWINVTFFLISILAVVIADAVQALFSLSTGIGVHGSVVKTFYVMFFEEGEDFRAAGHVYSIWYPRIFVAALYLFAHSSWTLGGTVFRKYAWLWTAAIQIAGFAIFVKITDGNVMLFSGIKEYVDIATFYWAGVISMCGLAILQYFCSYKVFKRMQVVNNKWVNL